MHKVVRFFGIGAIPVGISLGILLAAEANTAPTLTGHAEKGASIAIWGTQGGVASCASCHGANGIPDGSGAFPRLAGQDAYYLAKQLRDFTTDRRRNAIMTPFAKRLTEQEILDVSAYYAAQAGAPSLPPRPGAANPESAALFKTGETLAVFGTEAHGVQGCNNCHGPRGVGEAPAVPSLHGQSAAYIERQFEAWRRGWRSNSGAEQMHQVAHKLTPAETHAVAFYYENVRRDDAPSASPRP